MEKKRELIKNTAIITIGRISTQFISFLLLPFYTAMLSTAEYGSVDLINTYAQLLLPFVILQLDQALLRYMIIDRDTKREFEETITTVFLFAFFQITVISTLFIVVTAIFDNHYTLFLYLNVVAISFSSLFLQCARGFGDNITYSISSFLCSTITILLNILFIAGLGLKAEGMLIATVIGNIAASIFVFLRLRIYIYIVPKRFNKQLLIDMLKYSWPLVPNALIWWVVNASDRSIILLFLGISGNGILAVAHKFPSLVVTLYNVFHISWTESASLHLKEDDNGLFFSSVFDTVFRFFSCISILLIAIMPFIFCKLINIEYAQAYYQIPIYCIASLLNIIAGLYSVIYIANLKTKEIAKTSMLAGIINIIIHFVLIRFVGMYAASLSSAAAFGTMAVYRFFDSKRYVTHSISIKLLVYIIIMLILGFISYYSESRIIQTIFLIIAIGFSIAINVSSFARIKSFIKNKQ